MLCRITPHIANDGSVVKIAVVNVKRIINILDLKERF